MSNGLLMVFNDLSAQSSAPDDQTGSRWMEALSAILAHQKCRRGILATPPGFLQLMISAGCSIGRWLSNYKGGDSNERLLVKRIVDKRKSFAEYLPTQGNGEEAEYIWQEKVADGLAIAYREGGLAVSFPSEVQWAAPSLPLNKMWIEGNDLRSTECPVPHASTTVHVDVHTKFLDRCQTDPKDGQDLWDRRAELFENLDFCDSVVEQVCHLSGNDPAFNTLVRGLRDLQAYCDSWDTPHFDVKRLVRASGESPSTLARYSSERTFLCPDGKRRVFQWHLKRWEMRIHFFDFPGDKRLLVGYAGPHLSIVSE